MLKIMVVTYFALIFNASYAADVQQQEKPTTLLFVGDTGSGKSSDVNHILTSYIGTSLLPKGTPKITTCCCDITLQAHNRHDIIINISVHTLSPKIATEHYLKWREMDRNSDEVIEHSFFAGVSLPKKGDEFRFFDSFPQPEQKEFSSSSTTMAEIADHILHIVLGPNTAVPQKIDITISLPPSHNLKLPIRLIDFRTANSDKNKCFDDFLPDPLLQTQLQDVLDDPATIIVLVIKDRPEERRLDFERNNHFLQRFFEAKIQQEYVLILNGNLVTNFSQRYKNKRPPQSNTKFYGEQALEALSRHNPRLLETPCLMALSGTLLINDIKLFASSSLNFFIPIVDAHKLKQ